MSSIIKATEVSPESPYFEYIPIKNTVVKNGKILKGAYLVIDKRGIYPPFIQDADNFLWCNYEDCNDFFPTKKSVYAHHSRVHNKESNPNMIRKTLKKLEKEIITTY